MQQVFGSDYLNSAQYGTAYSRTLLICGIGICYAPLAPLILVATSLYFGISYVVEAHNVVYVYSVVIDSGATFWPLVFNRIMVGSFIAQLVLVGLYWIIAPSGFLSISMVPLPFITAMFSYYLNAKYEHVSSYLAVKDASEEALLSDDGRYLSTLDAPPIESVKNPVLTAAALQNGKDLFEWMEAMNIPISIDSEGSNSQYYSISSPSQGAALSVSPPRSGRSATNTGGRDSGVGAVEVEVIGDAVPK